MSVFWTWTANKLTLLTLALSFDTDYRTPLVRMAGSIPWTNQFVLHHPILQLFLSRAHAALQLKTSKKPLNNWKTSATTADKLIKPINWFELLLPWVFKTVPEWNCYCILFFFHWIHQALGFSHCWRGNYTKSIFFHQSIFSVMVPKNFITDDEAIFQFRPSTN